LAEKNDRPVRVIRAMADPYQKLSEKEDGIEHVKVSPLTLSAVDAKRLRVVDFISRSKSMLKDDLGLSDCVMEVKNKTPTHYMIFFLAYPLVSGLLIMIGVIGLYIEAKTPGFGFAGGFGIMALALFFIGHMGIGDSNWVPAFIFIVGVVLLALEVFVIPGFTVTGVAGILAVFASLLLAFGWENIELAVNTVGIAIIVAAIAVVLLTIYVLPESKFMKKMILTTSNSNEDGFSSHEQEKEDLLEKEGVVHTTLRPTGVVIIDNRRLDVVTEGDFIEKGERVKIIRIDGLRVIVEKV
jgi:membrane-bound serine protease (ClpP class)